jgi:apolipoprotein N-acyltransferase
VQPRTGLTPYLRFGNGPVVLFAILVVGLGVWSAKRRAAGAKAR